MNRRRHRAATPPASVPRARGDELEKAAGRIDGMVCSPSHQTAGSWPGSPQELLGALRKATEQDEVDVHRLQLMEATCSHELNRINDCLEKDGWGDREAFPQVRGRSDVPASRRDVRHSWGAGPIGARVFRATSARRTPKREKPPCGGLLVNLCIFRDFWLRR